MITLKHVLVATDFSEPSEVALTYGRQLARSFGATLDVLHVTRDLATSLGVQGYVGDWQKLQAQTETDATQELATLLSDEDREVLQARAVVLTSSKTAEAIVGYARDCSADVVVLGTHAQGGLAHFLIGSVAERVVRMAPCPVLTVRVKERDFVVPDALQRYGDTHA